MKPPPTLEALPSPPSGRTGWPWTEATLPTAGPQTSTGHPWPHIVVVTPSYNQGAFIEETIRSVLLQGYPNLSYLVMDGGSTDGTREVLERYAPWLTDWVSEPDRGQAHAINKGLARSTGDVAAYLNSDDIYLPGALLHVGETFAVTSFDVLVGRRRLEPLSTRPRDLWRRSAWLRRWRQRQPFVEPFLFDPGWSRYSLPQECVFWNQRRVAGMSFDERCHFCLDACWFAHIYSSAHVVHTTRRLGMCRAHEDTKTARLQHVRRDEVARMQQEMAPYASPVAPEVERRIWASYRRSSALAVVRRLLSPQQDAFFSYTHPRHIARDASAAASQ